MMRYDDLASPHSPYFPPFMMQVVCITPPPALTPCYCRRRSEHPSGLRHYPAAAYRSIICARGGAWVTATNILQRGLSPRAAVVFAMPASASRLLALYRNQLALTAAIASSDRPISLIARGA